MFQINECNNISESPIMQSIDYYKDEAYMREIANRNDGNDFKSISILNLNDNDSIGPATTSDEAFLFMDDNEQLHIATPDILCRKLKCNNNDKIKVISIFGNTGDGKSHTLNHALFYGRQVFKTSTEQNFCTVGVYAAIQKQMGVLCLDTEGLLGINTKNNRRMRMLLKILAISDIVIYRTRAERLHLDMFEFLGNASKAYTQHFAQPLRTLNSGASMGPAIIVFHETRFSKPLESSLESTVEDKLRDCFQKLNYDVNAFSQLHYIGIQTATNDTTNFNQLIAAIRMEIENNRIRAPRQLSVIFKAMKLLNQKFDGDIIEKTINPFPEQYFTCNIHCESCSRRCQRPMGHLLDGESHFNAHTCLYQQQFENKVYFCKNCYNNGKEVIVKFDSSNQYDSTFYGLTKFAWKGDIINCPQCGEIYSSRQHWFGNKAPEASSVRLEIVHVWQTNEDSKITSLHSGQIVVDSVVKIGDALSNVSGPIVKAIGSCFADKIAPSYWKPNSELIFCHACKRNFDATGMRRHHCRSCGEGFCQRCSMHEMPVPSRGWSYPVRVCNHCYNGGYQNNQVLNQRHTQAQIQIQQQLQQATDSDTFYRKCGETIYNTFANAAGAAIEYPKTIILDNVRPSYWVPDAEAHNCFICHQKFGTAEELIVDFDTYESIQPLPSLLNADLLSDVPPLSSSSHRTSLPAIAGASTSGASSTISTSRAIVPATAALSPSPSTSTSSSTSTAIASARAAKVPLANAHDLDIKCCSRHHCRSCGQAVCAACSKSRMSVPKRGWHMDVRVCDKCANSTATGVTTLKISDDFKTLMAEAIKPSNIEEIENDPAATHNKENERRNNNNNSNSNIRNMSGNAAMGTKRKTKY